MELEKSFKYNMYEIEMSCKMDLKELISIKLIINTFINHPPLHKIDKQLL